MPVIGVIIGFFIPFFAYLLLPGVQESVSMQTMGIICAFSMGISGLIFKVIGPIIVFFIMLLISGTIIALFFKFVMNAAITQMPPM